MITVKKRCLGAALSVLLLAGIWSGCGREEKAELPQEQERGRYVESEEAMPEGGDEDWMTKQIFVSEGSLNLLQIAEEGDSTILRQWKQQSEEFVDVSPEWMVNQDFALQTWNDMRLLQGEGQVQYLFARIVNEEGVYQNMLWRGEGSEAADITPEKWTVPNEVYGAYESILDIAALDNGTLVAVSHLSVDILSGEDGSILESQPISVNYGETMLSDGENVYLTALGSGGGVDSLEKWPGGKEENSMQIPLPVSGMTGVVFCALEDGSLVAASAQGIFRYNQVSETWEKLLEGSETDFALTTCWCIGLAAMEDGRIYGLFHQEGGGDRLVRYGYDPDAVTEVTQELKLYTVWEDSMLQQAAATYHREHPEVLITVEYAYALNDRYTGKAPDYDAVYQSLNTMLMGGEAPDILVMDHLNIESYAEKGLLVDISGIVSPMEENGELLANITGAYVQEDGSRYVVPLQFGFNMAVGRDIPSEDMASLEKLASFLSEREESYFGPLTVSELVDQFYPYFCEEIVNGNELDKEVLRRKLESLKTVAENSEIVETRGDERPFSCWNLTSHRKLGFEECEGFFDCMFPVAIMNYIGGDFAAYENCFIPLLQTGINAQSEYRDTALDFLKFALSQTGQGSSQYWGFPVNRTSLEAVAAADRSEIAAATSIVTEDGGEEMFIIDPFSDEIAQRIMKLCQGLDRPAREDEKIREELISALPGYLDGSRTLEETLDSLEGGLRMYLAE